MSPNEPQPETFLSPRELAARYGIPLQTIYRWRMEGKGPRGLTIGKHVRFRMSDVLAWEETRLDKE